MFYNTKVKKKALIEKYFFIKTQIGRIIENFGLINRILSATV